VLIAEPPEHANERLALRRFKSKILKLSAIAIIAAIASFCDSGNRENELIQDGINEINKKYAMVNATNKIISHLITAENIPSFIIWAPLLKTSDDRTQC